MFVRLQKIQHQRPIVRGSFARSLWGISKLIFLIALVGLCGWLFLQHKVQNDLKDHVQTKIAEFLEPSGLVVELGQARFVEGQGIQLNDLKLGLSEEFIKANKIPIANLSVPKPLPRQESNIEVYEAFIHAPATLTELATNELDVKAVEIRRAKLTAIRSVDGSWDFANSIKQLVSTPSDKETIPVALRDCEVRLIDQSNEQRPPIKLTGLNVFLQPIEHNGRKLIQVNGDFQSAAISRIEFTTFYDGTSGVWNANLTAAQAKLSADLVSLLPEDIQAQFNQLQSLNGIINFAANATWHKSLEQKPDFRVSGDIARLNVEDPRLPFAIDNASGQFLITPDGLEVFEAAGQIGEGSFTNCKYSQNGIINRRNWKFEGQLYSFLFEDTPRISQWLSPGLQKFVKEYSPNGTSDIEFALSHDGQTLRRTVNANLRDMSFEYFKMPYRVDHCTGRVEIKDDHCGFKVQSIVGQQPCELKGFAQGVGKSPTYEVNISVPGTIPIDRKLLRAIDGQPKLSKVIRAFQPTGHVSGIGKIEKRVPGGNAVKSFDVRLKQCSIRHDNFDYPIHNVSGLVQARDDRFTFSNLTGINGSGKVICNGTWNPTSGLLARFLCQSISLNDQLRYALKPEIREIWNGFRPRGTLDFMRVDMSLPIGEKSVDLVVEARMEKPTDITQANYVSINPIWFPYEINHLNGILNIGKGRIKLTNLKGLHQKTWMVCQGDGRYSDDAWSVKLKDLLVGSLKLDEDLLAAVPKSLAPPLSKLRFDGLLNVKGEFTVAGSKQTQTPPVQLASYRGQRSLTPPAQNSTSLAWDLRFDMNQAKMQIGFPIENLFGMVKLVGEYDGRNATCRGDLDIDSMMIYDLQVTKVRGPIWMDNFRSAAGVFAQPKQASKLNNISPIADTFQPKSLTGKLHKGTVHFDAEMNSSTKGEFYVQATLADGCLSTACRELAPKLNNVEGHSFAAVRMSGDLTGTHTHRGEGQIQLRDAKIYELPVFLSLLKILQVKQADRTAFDSSNIDFKIHGDTFDFDRMEFIGDAISLIGNGKMNLDRDINLNFYSVMGRNRLNIPLISELYKASSQKVLWINVDGKLENPQTHRHVLPQLNDSLQQLFQPNVDRRGTRGTGGLIGQLKRQPNNQIQSSAQWLGGSNSINPQNQTDQRMQERYQLRYPETPSNNELPLSATHTPSGFSNLNPDTSRPTLQPVQQSGYTSQPTFR